MLQVVLLLAIGTYATLGAFFNWRMLIYGRGSHSTRAVFGELGARWIYGSIGVFLLILGLALLLSRVFKL